MMRRDFSVNASVHCDSPFVIYKFIFTGSPTYAKTGAVIFLEGL